MFDSGATVYVVQGHYPEDIVINTLKVISVYDSTVWVQDEDGG